MSRDDGLFDDLAEIGRLALAYHRLLAKRRAKRLARSFADIFRRRRRTPDRVIADDMRLLAQLAQRITGDILVLQTQLPVVLAALDSIVARHEELSRGKLKGTGMDDPAPFRETEIIIPDGMPKKLPHLR